MASYPGAVKSFVSRNAGDVIQPAHVNDLQDEVNAIEAGLLNGTAPLNSSNSTMVTLTLSGGQLTFPAAQSASTDANTLDDYEEGTWTPAIGSAAGSGITYTTQTGSYVKIGKLVIASFNIVLSGLGTASGQVSVTGLPFTVENVGGSGLWDGQGCDWSTTTSSFLKISVLPIVNTTTANLSAMTAASTSSLSGVNISDLSATTTLRATFCYRASA